MKNVFLTSLLFLIIGEIHSQKLAATYGKIELQTIQTDTISHQYHFYIPKSISDGEQIPVFFIFDTYASADEVLNLFIQGSEAYKFGLVYMKTDITTTVLEHLKSFRFVFNDVFKNLPFDKSEFYLSGFGQGSNLAITTSKLSNALRGVLTSGSTLLLDEQYYPDTNDSFTYIGLVGYGDPFLIQFLNFHQFNLDQNRDSELLFFKGGHHWPDQNSITQALRRFKVKQILKSKVENKTVLLAELKAQEEVRLKELKESDDFVASELTLSSIIKNYKDIIDLKAYKRDLRALTSTSTYKKQLIDFYQSLELESHYNSEYLDFIREDIETGNLEGLPYWDFQVKHLDSLESKSSNYFKSQMAKRIKGSLEAITNALILEPQIINDPNSLIVGRVIQTKLNPKNAAAYLSLIQLASLDFDYYKALFYTEALFETGFKDVNRLKSLDGTDLLFIMSEYNQLEKKYGLDKL